MKRVAVFFLVLVLGCWFYYNQRPKKSFPKIIPKKIISPTTKIDKKQFVSEDLFIPYWTFDKNFVLDNNYDRAIFFDPDFSHIGSFVDRTKDFTYEKYITVKIDKYEQMTPEQIENVITIVKENNLNGLVLDLEIPIVFTDDNKAQINSFVKLFYTTAKKNYKSFMWSCTAICFIVKEDMIYHLLISIVMKFSLWLMIFIKPVVNQDLTSNLPPSQALRRAKGGMITTLKI